MKQEMLGFLDAVASAGPYANNPHLAPDNHVNTSSQFLQAGCSSQCPTNSVKALEELNEMHNLSKLVQV